jgi:hypothetical protein
MDPTTLLSGLLPDWAGTLGLDAVTIGALNEATNLLKDDFRRWGLEARLNRFYPFLPVAIGFGAFLLMGDGLWTSALDALKYGILSNFVWSVGRTTVKGG